MNWLTIITVLKLCDRTFTIYLKGNDVKFNNEGTRIIDKLKVRVFQYQRKTDSNVNWLLFQYCATSIINM